MFDLQIPKKSDKAVLFIEKVTNLFDELYVQPKQAGVKGVLATNHEKRLLHQALKHLYNSLPDENSSSKASQNYAQKIPGLVQRLKLMGKLLGFNEKGYHELKEAATREIDFANPIAHLNGFPFFVWRPHHLLRDNLNLYYEEGKYDWRDREIGPIDDSRDNIAYRAQGVTMYTKVDEAMGPHGLAIIKTKRFLHEDADTQLQINYCWDFLEGFLNNIHVDFKNGEVVRTYGSNLIEMLTTGEVSQTGDEKETLEFITDALKVTPQQFLYYVVFSNLNDEHRSDIGVLIKAAEEKKIPFYSLPNTNPSENLGLTIKKEATTLDTLSKLSENDSNGEDFKNLMENIDMAKKRKGFILADDYDFDPDTMTPTYKTIDYSNIEVDDFLKANLPEEFGNSTVWIHFKSSANKSYSVGHMTYGDNISNIKISSKDKDRVDFFDVQKKITKYFKGRDKEEIAERDNDYCVDIKLKQNSFQKIQKSLTEFYQKEFSDVKISSLHMYDLNLDEVIHTGLPMDKAKFGDVVLK